MADREPIGGDDRRTGEMTDPRPAQGASHASHDLFVIAAASDRDADAATRTAAESQARDCSECAALLADLRDLSAGLAALPRELPSPRDFRLTPERAASLRRRSGRAVIDSLFRSPSLRPFGNALAAIGFAGLLLTVGLPTLVGGLGGGTASAPALAPAATAAGLVPGAMTAAPADMAGQGTGSTGGKSGPTTPAVDNGGAAAGATAAPGASPAGLYGVATSEPGRSSTGGGGASEQGPGGAASPAPLDPLSSLPWLSLGAFLVGIALLGMARLGGRSRAG